jgi:hypothetical protein
MRQVFSVASQFLIATGRKVAHRADSAVVLAVPADSSNVLRAVLRDHKAASRIKEHRVNSLGSSLVVHDPSIPRVQGLLRQVREDRVRVLDSAHALVGLALRVPVALEPLAALHRQRARLHVHSVHLVRHAAVDVSSIPRPKKAR